VLIGKENCVDAVFYGIGPEMFIIDGNNRICDDGFNFTV
jgi:hypothetical protein